MSRTLHRISVRSLAVVFLGAAALAATPVQAQSYPFKTIEWISHSSAGSGTDLFNRNVSGMMEKQKILNVPFTHTNRVGGNGVIAYQYVQNKKGDPNVVIAMSVTVILTQSILPDTGLSLDSLTPIIRFAQDPQVVAVRTESKFRTYKELTDAAKDGNVVAGITGPGQRSAALYYIERATGAKSKYARSGRGDAVIAAGGTRVTREMSEMRRWSKREDAHLAGRANAASRRCPTSHVKDRLQDRGRHRARLRHAARRAEGSRRGDGSGVEARLRQQGIQGLRRPQHVRGRVSEQRGLREGARRAARAAARVPEGDPDREVTAGSRVHIWVDADACPAVIKDILFRAAERLRLQMTLVANKALRIPPSASSMIISRACSTRRQQTTGRIGRDLVITATFRCLGGLGAARTSDPASSYPPDNIAERLPSAITSALRTAW